jgi:antibiotic biosynthesis monooxygenase (ABM) superfamily enzyme
MRIRAARASTVIIHHVPPDQVDRFLTSEREITRVATGFPGYQSTEIYPPAPPASLEWVVILHFDDETSLQKWLDSSERRACLDRLSREVGKYELKTLPSGFGAWFVQQMASTDSAPIPGWKMALTVLLALYPVVMLLSLTVGRVTRPLGFAVQMLIANVLSICILQWGVMPGVTRALNPWLEANNPADETLSLWGFVAILLAIAVATLAFQRITG